MELERAETINQRVHSLADVVGKLLVDGFHYLALFAIVLGAGAILLLAVAALVIRYASFKFPSGQTEIRR